MFVSVCVCECVSVSVCTSNQDRKTTLQNHTDRVAGQGKARQGRSYIGFGNLIGENGGAAEATTTPATKRE